MITATVPGSVRRLAPLPLLIGSCLTSIAPQSVAASLPSSIMAAPARPPIHAFSDSRTLPTAATLLTRLPAARSLLCGSGQPAPLTSPTLDQALATIQATLLHAYGAGALAAIDNGPQARDANRAEHIAAGGVLGNAPGAAVEALLLAHKQAPTDPRPLVNAAALLPDLGLANEALALLDAADRLHAPRGGAPLGMSLTAVSKNNRGYALLKLRQWQKAEAPLREATALSPLLTEADLNLGEALLCAGDQGQAARFFVAGGRRNTFRGDAIEEGGDLKAPTGSVRADAIFDLSAGVVRQMPDLTYPSTPEQALAMYPALAQVVYKTVVAVTTARNASFQAVYARLPRNLNALTLQRTQDIMGAISGAYLAPGLHKLRARVNADAQEVGQLDTDFWGGKVRIWQGTLSPDQFKARCTSSLPAAHARFLSALRQFDRDTRLWWQAYSKYTTGLEANIADPAYHALAENQIDQTGESLYYSGLLNTSWYWFNSEYQLRDACIGASAIPATTTVAPVQETPPAGDYGPGIAAPHNVVLTLPPPFDYITLKANCESVTTQVESPDPGIKGFISATQDLRRGETTIVIGPKAGVSLPGTGISGGFETGIYVTKGTNGVKDWGVSVNLTATTSVSPNGLVGFEANAPVTISLVGAIDYIPTAFGFTH